MGIVRNEINIVNDGLNKKGTSDSFQHIYEQLQMIDHVLGLQVDDAIHESYQDQNQQINKAMLKKNKVLYTLRNL